MLEGSKRCSSGIPEVKPVNGSEIGIWGYAVSGGVECVVPLLTPELGYSQ